MSIIAGQSHILKQCARSAQPSRICICRVLSDRESDFSQRKPDGIPHSQAKFRHWICRPRLVYWLACPTVSLRNFQELPPS